MEMQGGPVTTQDTEPTAREMSYTEKLARAVEISNECLSSAEALESQIFGAHPVPCEDVSPPHDVSLEGALGNLTDIQCRLRDVLANIIRRL